MLNLSKDMSRNGIQNSNEMIVLGKHTEISKVEFYLHFSLLIRSYLITYLLFKRNSKSNS